MAKGFKKEGLDLVFWEFQRGFGRRGGMRAEKVLIKELSKRVLNDSSSFRKQVDRFVLPGTFNSAKNKMYGLIDSFYNEYVTTKAMLQRTMYLKDDIEFIERKLKMVERLIDNEVHERSYDRLVNDWLEYKQQSVNQ